jgi:uncharacterized protein (TIGR02300 family)
LRFVAKPELGTKRLCAGCGAKFYDLSKNPPVCPSCGTVFEIVAPVTRARPDAARAAAAAAAARAEAETPEPAEAAELVSLEDADAEQQGKTKKAPAGDGAEEADDVEAGDDAVDDDDDDDTFIEETEDEDTDVTEIIGGDIEDEEES